MASQKEEVQGGTEETTSAEDTAKFSGAWDAFEKADEAGQPATDAGRQEAEGSTDANQEGSEAGQDVAQPNPDGEEAAAGVTPGADAGNEPPSREEISDDVLASADPTVRAYIERLQDERRQARRVAKSNGSRLAHALNELHALKQTREGQAEGNEDEAGKARKEKLNKVREDYEELAPLVDMVETLGGQVEKVTAGDIARAESEVAAALEENYDALLERHADLPSIIADPAYKQWVDKQTPAIQRIVSENSQAVVNVDDADLVFTLFKQAREQADPAAAAEAKAAEERRKAQLDAGRTATGRRNPTASSSARLDGGTYGESWDEFDRDDRRKAASRR